MDQLRQTRRRHLFVLHVWLEERGDGNTEWRGEIEHVLTLEKRYFREWQVLLDFVQRSCEQAQRRLSSGAEDIPMPKKKLES